MGSDIDGEAAFDDAGTDLAMSADGTRIAIGLETRQGGVVRVVDMSCT